jgi:hypothetical protein
VADNFEDRKKLTFEQAEGAAPLPSQLKPREVSPQLRALLWTAVYSSLKASQSFVAFFDDPWQSILREEFIFHRHGMIDEFKNDSKKLIPDARWIFERGDYLQIFGWLEFVLKHRMCPPGLHDDSVYNFAARPIGLLTE